VSCIISLEAGTAAQSIETVFGATDKPGPYAALVKWHPGYMCAAQRLHRLLFVISGTWRVNSGDNVGTEATVTCGWLLCRALRACHTLME
jgi:hypothetical protein